MPAETLQCPSCGASASTGTTQCTYCGAALATIACPSCFGMMLVGAKFCSHCGARAERAQVPATEKQLCPRCQVNMNAVVIGSTHLRECPRCEGIWADAIALQQICTEREQQAAVLGTPAPPTKSLPHELAIRYVPCPVCRNLMNRVNFAHCSGVIIAVCRAHGTWFEKDDLRRIVEFIRSGGLEKARAREIADVEDQRRRLRTEQIAQAAIGPDAQVNIYAGAHNAGVSAIADIAGFLLGCLMK